eukprot:2117350-Lingulodinium_polyedra.AAC.1
MIKSRLPRGVSASTRRSGPAPFRRRSQTSSATCTRAMPPPVSSQRSQVFLTAPAKVGSISTKKLACKAPLAPIRRR